MKIGRGRAFETVEFMVPDLPLRHLRGRPLHGSLTHARIQIEGATTPYSLFSREPAAPNSSASR
jgi:hypothetical protein